MTRRQRAAYTLWLAACLCVSLASVLSLVSAPRAEAGSRIPGAAPRFSVEATTAVSGELAAILAAELLLGPGIESTYLPAVMR